MDPPPRPEVSAQVAGRSGELLRSLWLEPPRWRPPTAPRPVTHGTAWWTREPRRRPRPGRVRPRCRQA